MQTGVHIKNGVLAGLAAFGGLLTESLGGWDMTLQALAAFMAVDYCTGLAAGALKRSNNTAGGGLESRAGFLGLVRKGAILLLVFLGAMLDQVTGSGCIRPAVCCFFIANEGLSILENLGLLGVPYPRALRDVLEALGKQGDGDSRKKGK